MRLLVPLGLACLCITFSGCEGRRFERHANLVGSPTANPLAEWWITPTPWPDAMATPLHATRGDELDPRCPPNFIVVADATAVAEGVGIVGAEIPGLGLQDYSTVAEAFAGLVRSALSFPSILSREAPSINVRTVPVTIRDSRSASERLVKTSGKCWDSYVPRM